MKQKPLLILDLDECLIHTSGLELGREADFYYKHLRVYKRPFLQEFLTKAAEYYRLAVWSLGTDKYVQEISKNILPKGLSWEFTWGRSQARRRTDMFWGGSFYYKNLDKLKRYGYKLEDITLIDNNPVMVIHSVSKVITISTYWGEEDDTDLKIFMENCPNFIELTDIDKHENRDFHNQFIKK